MDQDKIDQYRKAQEEERLRLAQEAQAKNSTEQITRAIETSNTAIADAMGDLAKGEDIDEVIKELKQAQLASYLSSANKKSDIILADSTSLGEAVAGLGEKLDALAKNLQSEKADKELIKTVKEEMAKVVTALNRDTDSEMIDAINGLRPLLEGLEINPVINVPEPVINLDIPKLDLKPLSTDIKSVTAAVKAIKYPTIDMSAVIEATNKVSKAIGSLSFPMPNYILPYLDINGKATQVQLDANGNLPTAGSTPTTVTNGLTTGKLICAASTNATSIKASAGKLYKLNMSNSDTVGYWVKLYNKASSPSVGTDVPRDTIFVPAGGGNNIPIGVNGLYFGTGIALAATLNATDADATVVTTANKLVINYEYI